jgi:hypothetical protein
MPYKLVQEPVSQRENNVGMVGENRDDQLPMVHAQRYARRESKVNPINFSAFPMSKFVSIFSKFQAGK